VPDPPFWLCFPNSKTKNQKPKTTLEKINNMTFPLTVENDTDATQFIIAAAQGTNQIKNCYYNAQKNAALQKTVNKFDN